MSRYQYFK